VGIYFASLLDTLLCIHHDNPNPLSEKIPRTQKNPWFAVFVSRVIPGLGHLYINQSVLGLILLTVSLILYRIDGLFTPLLVVTPLLTAIATYHAYITFPRKHLHADRQMIAVMAGLIFIIGLLINFVPQGIEQRIALFKIPSESMLPTLEVGDRVFVAQDERYHPQRGHIVVFTPNDALKKLDPQVSAFYIKRIIAIPGDTIQIRQGKVWLNGQSIEENYTYSPAFYEMDQLSVAPDTYFVLGDNRNASFDSHIWGTLPRVNIVGEAYKIYWPPHRVRSLQIPPLSISLIVGNHHLTRPPFQGIALSLSKRGLGGS
jgi:signal peptidase I